MTADTANATLQERHLRQRDALVALVGGGGASGDDLAGTVRRITEIDARALGVARVSVWRFNPERTALRCEDLYELQADRHTIGPDRPAALYQSRLRAQGVTSMLDVPLLLGGTDAGVLCHEHVGPRRQWTADEESFAVAVADLVSLALERSERKLSEQVLLARANQQVLVAALGRRALSDDDLDQLFAQTAAAIAGGLGVDCSTVTLLGSDRASILKAGVGWRQGWVGRPGGVAAEHSLMAFVLASQEPVIVDDFRREARFEPSDMLVTHDIVSGIDVVIGGGAMALGVLGAYARGTRRFSTDDVGFLQSLANTLSIAVQRTRADEHLAYVGQHDSLTDLPNRLLLTDRLNVAIAQTDRNGELLAVMHMDLDRFKNVNDLFGHELGDRVLQEVAARLTGCVRAADTVSRQGGDEFLMVFPDVETEQDAARIAQKLLAAVRAPMTLDGKEVVLSGSIGIACFPGNGHDAGTLLRNADAAMHVAKVKGRSGHRFYSAEMDARALERLLLEGDLRRAVEHGQLFLAYQPQVDLGTGALVGVEALVRWRHPTRGVVPPGQFIPIAEESGLIVAIGTWVMESACREYASWIAEGWITGTVAVNVSAYQFRQPDFVEVVAAALSRSGLPAVFLELEVTESVVMQDLDEVMRKLHDLHRLGVKLAIDDFGTGYSSLSYLTQFPIWRLKIDQSFVRGLPDDRGSAAIAQAIISMGHSLGLTVLAEGIETAAQEDHLRSLWCDAGQGYFYAKPMPAEECAAYLREYAPRAPLQPIALESE